MPSGKMSRWRCFVEESITSPCADATARATYTMKVKEADELYSYSLLLRLFEAGYIGPNSYFEVYFNHQ